MDRREFLIAGLAALVASSVHTSDETLALLAEQPTLPPPLLPRRVIAGVLRHYMTEGTLMPHGRLGLSPAQMLRPEALTFDEFFAAEVAFCEPGAAGGPNSPQRRAFEAEIQEAAARSQDPVDISTPRLADQYRWNQRLFPVMLRMAWLHAAYATLKTEPAPSVMRAIKDMCGDDPQRIAVLQRELGGWPFEGGPEKQEELEARFAQEREALFRLIRAKLPAKDAQWMCDKYGEVYQSEAELKARCSDAAISADRYWLREGMIDKIARGATLSVYRKKNETVIDLDMSAMKPRAGNDERTLDTERRLNNLFVHGALTERIYPQWEVGGKRLEFSMPPRLFGAYTLEVPPDVKTQILNASRMTIRTSDPGLDRLARELLAHQAQAEAGKRLVKLATAYPGEVKVVHAEAVKEGRKITLQLRPPSGAARISDFSRSIAELRQVMCLVDAIGGSRSEDPTTPAYYAEPTKVPDAQWSEVSNEQPPASTDRKLLTHQITLTVPLDSPLGVINEQAPAELVHR